VPRTTLRSSLTALGAALVVAGATACAPAGADDTRPAASTSAPSTTVSRSTPGTTAPTTTVAPTTMPATTVAPPTTVDPIAQIEADFWASEDAYYECGAAPETCDVSEIAVPGSPAFENLSKFFDKLAAADWRAEAGDDGYMVIEGITLGPTGKTATMRVCSWDTDRIYDPAGHDEPDDDIIVDDTESSKWAAFELQLTDRGWQRTSASIENKQLWENQCPPPVA
jgi:hypothetical protein